MKFIFIGEAWCGEIQGDVLFSIYFGQERSPWDDMDSCSFREKAQEESGC